MANSLYLFHVAAAGPNPVVSGDKRLTLLNIIRLFTAIITGQRAGSGNLTVKAEHTGVAASAVVTCAAVANADTVTINGQALTATQHNARGTFTFVSVIATDVAVVDGVSFVGFASAATLGEATFDTRTSDTAAAASLAAQINAYAFPTKPVAGRVTATSAAGVVTVRAVDAGTGGNSITISSPDSTITANGATLAGGAAVATNQFDFGGSNTQTGAALAAALAASTTNLVSKHVSGSNAAGAVTISALTAGHSGNAITIATSNATRLAITGSVSRLASGSSTIASFAF